MLRHESESDGPSETYLDFRFLAALSITADVGRTGTAFIITPDGRGELYAISWFGGVMFVL